MRWPWSEALRGPRLRAAAAGKSSRSSAMPQSRSCTPFRAGAPSRPPWARSCPRPSRVATSRRRRRHPRTLRRLANGLGGLAAVEPHLGALRLEVAADEVPEIPVHVERLLGLRAREPVLAGRAQVGEEQPRERRRSVEHLHRLEQLLLQGWIQSGSVE